MAERVNSVAELIERTQNMPLEKMRFFINEDRKEPKCFGIYQEESTGHWIVYKNKANGSRAVRYSGPDEAFAAQELWAKINSEIDLRRGKQALTAAEREARKKAQRRETLLIGAGVVAFLAVAGWYTYRHWNDPHRGYYRHGDDLYYYQSASWYYYDDGDWYPYYDYDVDDDTWYEEAEYTDDYPYADASGSFEQSEYYEEPSDSDSDDFDFGGWDSSDTDWDSDW